MEALKLARKISQNTGRRAPRGLRKAPITLTLNGGRAEDGHGREPLPARYEEAPMPHYLTQVTYTTESWQALVRNPQNRIEAVRPAVEKLGGKIENAWFAFGDYDAVFVVQMPDNVSAAALSMAASSGGSLKAIKTTPLLSAAEAVEAMKKAAGSGYRAVGAD
jgi:uncharacterized protein with GYD domain